MVVGPIAHDPICRTRNLVLSDAYIIPLIHACIHTERMHSPSDDFRCLCPVERRTGNVDGIISVAKVVVHGSSPAPPSDPRHPSFLRRSQINLFPRILVAPNYNAWAVTV